MARDPADVLAHELIELAQVGRHGEALARIEDEARSRGQQGLSPALHFARCVALDMRGEHAAAVRTAGEGIAAAVQQGREGWRAACLAMRAELLVQHGSDDPSSFDEGRVLHDLAQAQVALGRDIDDPRERATATNGLALAYSRLRLYELARPVFESTLSPSGRDDEAMSAGAVIQQLNLAELELTWALELFRVGMQDEAREHCRTAVAHARDGEARSDGSFRDAWERRARVLAGCARGLYDDPPAAARGLATAREELVALEQVGNDHERSFCAPLLGLGLARAGRYGEGLAIVTAALDEVQPHTDPLLVAATRHAELVLLAPSSRGAVAGLELGYALSLVLWRQRGHRLAAAEAILRFEQLRAEHETVSRDSDVDALTGAASRRALDRRFASLEARRAAGGPATGVMVVDVDGLKRVNDRVGHRAGDVVLRGIGGALLSSVRGEDLVGRYGGDEFVVLLAPGGDVDQALDDVARRMLHAVRSLRWPDEFGHRPGVSIGLAIADNGGRNLEQAMVAADRAMYAAKRAGGDAAITADEPALERPAC